MVAGFSAFWPARRHLSRKCRRVTHAPRAPRAAKGPAATVVNTAGTQCRPSSDVPTKHNAHAAVRQARETTTTTTATVEIHFESAILSTLHSPTPGGHPGMPSCSSGSLTPATDMCRSPSVGPVRHPSSNDVGVRFRSASAPNRSARRRQAGMFARSPEERSHGDTDWFCPRPGAWLCSGRAQAGVRGYLLAGVTPRVLGRRSLDLACSRSPIRRAPALVSLAPPIESGSASRAPDRAEDVVQCRLVGGRRRFRVG